MMNMDEALPALRAVDIFPVDHEGAPHYCLSDNLGFAESQVLLSQPAFFIAAHLDGETSCSEIQRRIQAQFGGLDAPPELIFEVVQFLDDKHFLMSAGFQARVREEQRAYLESPTRPAWHAGNSYPESKEELDQFFLEMFAAEDGPGLMAAAPGDGPALRCLVVPHLDYERGALGYSHGYHRLYGAGKPDTVFIFGVAHAGAPTPFVLSRKGFETPFGVVAVDEEALDKLEGACDWDPYEWELVHRTEHSVEFHAVLLAWLYGPEVKIVPILTASLEDEEETTDEAGARPGVARFLEACRDYAENSGRKVTMIASADLAHVGKRFGDDYDIDEAIGQAIAVRDEADLNYVLRGDGDGWYRAVMVDDNARRVCGVGCTFGALKAARTGSEDAEILVYGQAADPAGGMVSYTAVALP